MELSQQIQQSLRKISEQYRDGKVAADAFAKDLSVLLEKKENLEQHPIFKDIAKILEKKINEITLLLSTDSKYLNEEGRILSATRDSFRTITKVLSIKIIDTNIEDLEKTIYEKAK